MGFTLNRPPEARWGFEGWARASQHRTFPSGWAFEKSLQGKNLSEWRALLREPDPELFGESALAIAQTLEQRGNAEVALAVYQEIADAGDFLPTYVTAKANLRIKTLMGGGPAGARVERLLGNFAKAATDYRTLVPMVAASVIYPIVRTASWMRLTGMPQLAWFNRGRGARFVASLLGSAAEIPTFVLASRGLNKENSGTLLGEFAGAGVFLGALRASSWIGQVGKNLLAHHRFSGSLLSSSLGFLGLWGGQHRRYYLI